MLTLLSSPSTLLSLTSSLHSAATNADWAVLGCETLVTVAHGVGMGYLGSRVAPVQSSLKSCLKPTSSRRTGSRFTRFCNFLRRKAAAKPAEKTTISAMKGTRASSRAQEVPRCGGGCWSWVFPSCSIAKKRVRFNEQVVTKDISRCDMAYWDRDFDRSARPYAMPLKRVHFGVPGQVPVRTMLCAMWLEPDGRNQLHFPRTRFVRDGRDPQLEDDDGDIVMDLS